MVETFAKKDVGSTAEPTPWIIISHLSGHVLCETACHDNHVVGNICHQLDAQVHHLTQSCLITKADIKACAILNIYLHLLKHSRWQITSRYIWLKISLGYMYLSSYLSSSLFLCIYM